MKSTFTLFFAAILSVFAFSQSQRMVLLEQFTQASCGPCASANPTIKTLLANNPEKITSIFYHTSWPGYDPMYLHNTEDQNARVGYYGVNSVPYSVLDGNYYTGSSFGWNINTVNARYNVPSPFDIDIYSHLSADQSKYQVHMLVKAAEDATINTVAHMVIVEKLVQFTSPPGSNGETQFVNVLKKMLPTKNGISIPTMQAGEYFIFQFEWQHANVYSLSQLATVGFIQNNADKEVLQAANSYDTPFTPLFTNDVEITEWKNIPYYNCMGTVKPVVKVRNNGSAGVTSMEIVYTVNGGSSQSYQWTGNLAFLESEWVELPETSFSIMDENFIEITALNPNGSADEYPKNNIRVHQLDKALQVTSPVSLALKLDDNPGETTWEVLNSQGTVIYSGGPYTQAGQFVIEQFPLGQTDCYRFFIYDSGGDGLTGTGIYKLVYDGTKVIAQGTDFGSKDEAQFSIAYTDIPSQAIIDGFAVFPNPSSGSANFEFILSERQQVELSIYDLAGKPIMIHNAGFIPAGKKTLTIDISGFESGLYLVKLQTGEHIQYSKVLLSK